MKQEEDELGDRDQTDSDSSSSGGDDDNEVMAVGDQDQINLLHEQIVFSPTYASYEAYITALRNAMRLENLRQAREEMSSRFPLDTGLWLEWINDEKCMNSSNEVIIRLFKKALSDFHSLDIYLQYTEFISSLGDHNSTLAAFEEAAAAYGSHFTEGAIVWESFRSSQSSPEFKKKLYIRQLGIPLDQMNKSLEEYQDWHLKTFNCPAPMVPAYAKALEVHTRLLSFESGLCQADPIARREAWLSYLLHQMTEKNVHVARTTNLFERAVKIYFSDEIIWSYFIRFLRMHGGPDTQWLLQVCRRSVRNCPWSSSLWCEFVSSAAIADPTLKLANDTLQEARSQNFSSSNDFIRVTLELIYLFVNLARSCSSTDYSEEIRALFQTASAYAEYTDSTATITDISFNLYRFWADVERGCFHDLPRARQCWDIILQSAGKHFDCWRAYLQFEQQIGDPIKCRKAFNRALHLFQHELELDFFCSQWISYESEHGSVRSRDDAFVKCSTLQHKRRPLGMQEQLQSSSKRKSDFTTEEVSSKRAKALTSDGQEDLALKPASAIAESRKTAFIVNLPHQITEMLIRKAFEPFGDIVAVRLPTDVRGHTRGFGYVDFASEGSVNSAIQAMNRTEFHGRIITVEHCRSDSTKKAKRSVPANSDVDGRVEKNIVFLKGFDKTKSQAAVENFLQKKFEHYGTVRHIRAPPGIKAGTLKGFAYIEFEGDDQAFSALREDGFEWDGNIVSVSISKPPSRQKPVSLSKSSNRNVHSGLTKLPQVPSFKQNFRKPSLDVPVAATPIHRAQEAARNELPKSNDDFRNLFIKKS